MILVTGATGTVGTAVLAAIGDRSRFRLGVRTPGHAPAGFAAVPFHRDAIRDRGEIRSAAGGAKTSYVNVRDVGAVAVKALTEDGHESRAYTLTGPEELGLDDIAAILSHELGRPVRYLRSSMLGFYREARARGAVRPLAVVMTGIGLVARSGLARSVDPTLERLLGRPATSFARYAHDERSAWSDA